ncbi:transposase [Clostridium tagluense]|nr:transposase [Clostridium tagluense]MBW9158721.1 transposase [Clostridium tagluense]WLC67406.1 transposase [Clostridium tagluense]
MYKEIIDLVSEFRTILKSKAITKINKWMEQACSLNNKFINSFIHGITRDITAVKNAIIYDYNNGLAEGSVNKLKVIKRIMYGRNSFDMLYKKLLWLEKNRFILAKNTNVSDIAFYGFWAIMNISVTLSHQSALC